LRKIETDEAINYDNDHFALGLKTDIGYKYEFDEILDLKIGVFNRLFK
jgi:hypothetical protein